MIPHSQFNLKTGVLQVSMCLKSLFLRRQFKLTLEGYGLKNAVFKYYAIIRMFEIEISALINKHLKFIEIGWKNCVYRLRVKLSERGYFLIP